MISISADVASEDEQSGILHFSGNFRLLSNDWNLTSDAATVYGDPDKPDRVVLEGSPARFLVNRSDSADPDQIEATAPIVEYSRADDLLLLSNGAALMMGGEVIRSRYIEYNISTNRYKAGGADGVLIEVPPRD
jgi:lipopolysaccharide transport protein LptA